MLDEFLTGDSDLPVCMATDDDNWQTVFFEELVGSHSSQQEEDDEEIDVENDNSEDAAPKIRGSFSIFRIQRAWTRIVACRLSDR